jgi:hypothetical protein
MGTVLRAGASPLQARRSLEMIVILVGLAAPENTMVPSKVRVVCF